MATLRVARIALEPAYFVLADPTEKRVGSSRPQHGGAQSGEMRLSFLS